MSAGANAAVEGTVFEDRAPELTRTYAEALVNAAANGEQAEAVLDDLDAIVAEVLRAFPPFAELLNSPAISVSAKDRLLKETFEGRSLPTVVRFLRVLNNHGRLALLPAIARRAREVWDRRQNRQPVLVRSAVPLDEDQREALRQRLERLTGATPMLRLEVDPSLIGGLVVQVGDDLYDASVRHRLEQLRRSLTEGKTHEIQSRRDHFSHPA